MNSNNQMSLKDIKLCYVIFGASGDLALRMLMPSLETISCYNPFNEGTKIVGIARTKYTDNELKDRLVNGIKQFARLDSETADDNETCELPEFFLRRFTYISGEYTSTDTYLKLKDYLQKGEFQGVLIYMATPPTIVKPIVEMLLKNKIVGTPEQWVRIIAEKPFGWDYNSAIDLNKELHKAFDEESIYRIDHYLAKETVMNIFTFRWGNAIWEPLWNRNFISHVEIFVEESVDVGTRIGYYNEATVIRDMIQNHLLQMMSIVAMEPPSAMNSKAIRDEKMKVLQAIRPIKKEDVILGQYIGYRDHKGVPEDSTTPTLAFIRFFIDNWRWKDVPFYVCSGKTLSKKESVIKLVFKEVPHAIFGEKTIKKPNILVIKIQPKESIRLKQHVKVPGMGLDTLQISLNFRYEDKFGPNALHGAYERVILDAIRGDQSFFPRADEIEQCWKIVSPILQEKYFVIPYAQKMDITMGALKRGSINNAQKNLFKNPSDLIVKVAEQMTRIITETIAAKGICNIALSGGSSPKSIFSLLSTTPYASRIDFDKLHIFFVDERFVPQTSNESNYKMITESLINFINIPEKNIHRIKVELGLDEAAADYEKTIIDHFGTEQPEFDMIHLGMGVEGHIASLFPGTPAVNNKKNLVVGQFVPHVNMNRITMCSRLLNNAKNVIFVILDTSKNDALNLVFNAPYCPSMLPAQLLRLSNGKVTWNIVT